MSILLALLIGAIVGWLAASFTGRHEGIFGSMVIGIVGAFIGGVLSYLVSGTAKSYLGLSWSGVLWSFVGALVLSALLNAAQHKNSKHI